MAHKRGPAVIAQTAQAKADKAAVKARLPDLTAFLAIPNPSNPQQTAAVKLLAQAQLEATRGLIGG